MKRITKLQKGNLLKKDNNFVYYVAPDAVQYAKGVGLLPEVMVYPEGVKLSPQAYYSEQLGQLIYDLRRQGYQDAANEATLQARHSINDAYAYLQNFERQKEELLQKQRDLQFLHNVMTKDKYAPLAKGLGAFLTLPALASLPALPAIRTAAPQVSTSVGSYPAQLVRNVMQFSNPTITSGGTVALSPTAAITAEEILRGLAPLGLTIASVLEMDNEGSQKPVQNEGAKSVDNLALGATSETSLQTSSVNPEPDNKLKPNEPENNKDPKKKDSWLKKLKAKKKKITETPITVGTIGKALLSKPVLTIGSLLTGLHLGSRGANDMDSIVSEYKKDNQALRHANDSINTLYQLLQNATKNDIDGLFTPQQ